MKNQIFFGLVAIVGILGAYVAFVTVDRYEIIVRAALGFTVLYLLWREYFLPKGVANRPIDSRIELPVSLRFLVIDFMVSVIAFWASIQLLQLVWYLRDILPN
jgi:hypothetical protein